MWLTYGSTHILIYLALANNFHQFSISGQLNPVYLIKGLSAFKFLSLLRVSYIVYIHIDKLYIYIYVIYARLDLRV